MLVDSIMEFFSSTMIILLLLQGLNSLLLVVGFKSIS